MVQLFAINLFSSIDFRISRAKKKEELRPSSSPFEQVLLFRYIWLKITFLRPSFLSILSFVITFGHTKSDNIDREIIITDDFYLVSYSEWDFEIWSHEAADKINQ